MKINLLVAAMIAAVSMLGQAQAQDAAKTRAEVKKEAASANKGDKSVAAAEGPAQGMDKSMSTKTKAEVKAEAKAANKAGMAKAGEGAAPMADKTPSTKTKAEVKEEAKKANLAGEIKKGEASK